MLCSAISCKTEGGGSGTALKNSSERRWLTHLDGREDKLIPRAFHGIHATPSTRVTIGLLLIVQGKKNVLRIAITSPPERGADQRRTITCRLIRISEGLIENRQRWPHGRGNPGGR